MQINNLTKIFFVSCVHLLFVFKIKPETGFLDVYLINIFSYSNLGLGILNICEGRPNQVAMSFAQTTSSCTCTVQQ